MFWIESGQHVNISLEKQQTNLFFIHWLYHHLETNQLCNSSFQGAFPCREMPVILGHEFSGVVTSVGRDVKHLKQGDNVVVDPNRYPDDNAVLISSVSTTNAMTQFCTVCLSNDFFHNSDPSQHPEHKLHAEYKP
jgi:threonine dehydrogenase-like Zn-dependent dehydrogenase